MTSAEDLAESALRNFDAAKSEEIMLRLADVGDNTRSAVANFLVAYASAIAGLAENAGRTIGMQPRDVLEALHLLALKGLEPPRRAGLQ